MNSDNIMHHPVEAKSMNQKIEEMKRKVAEGRSKNLKPVF